MQALQDWSAVRVSLVSVGWIVFCVLALVTWVLVQILWASTGSAGIGAVSILINELMLLVLLGPPVLLIGGWLVLRWR
jgi:hypothetical protein